MMTVESPFRRPAPPAHGPRTEILPLTNFGIGQSRLAEGMAGKIIAFLAIKPASSDKSLNHLLQTGHATLYVKGHASDTGTPDLNAKIAAGRIESVEKFLKEVARIDPHALGNSENSGAAEAAQFTDDLQNRENPKWQPQTILSA